MIVDAAGGHERIGVGKTCTAADGDFVIEQDVFFDAFGFGFGGVHPPGVDADFEKTVVDLVPVVIARGGISNT